jgi:nicotinamide/nicotinate riboside kinase
VGAIDVAFLSATLAYVRQHGTLPPRLRSKEDQNDTSDPGVDPSKIDTLRRQVGECLTKQQERLSNTAANGKYTAEEATKAGPSLTIAFLDGFLLYAPPESEAPQHVLRPIHNNIHLHLFFPAPYDLVKSRREARSGYATIGPAPTPKPPQDSEEQQHQQQQQQLQETTVDLENAEHKNQQQNFWTDPPGYVDDIVWPRYVQDHAWLLLPADNNGRNKKSLSQMAQESAKDSDNTTPDDELLKLAGDGTNVRTDAGVTVAPGKGRLPIPELLDWTVREVLRCLEVEDVA